MEEARKLVPVSVIVVSRLPATADVGVTEVSDGEGLLCGGVVIGVLLPELQLVKRQGETLRLTKKANRNSLLSMAYFKAQEEVLSNERLM